MSAATTAAGGQSAWLDYLPALYRESAEPGAPPFLGRFLLAFERVFGELESRLDHAADYFDPTRTPPEFLEWLAAWVGVTLRGDLDAVSGADDPAAARRGMARQLIANAVPLYRLRGTRRGLEELIRLYTGGLSPTITELTSELQVGVSSRIGEDTVLGGGAPHFFHVLLRLPEPSPAARVRFEQIARAILDIEKPAHTRYHLEVVTPEMQVGVHSQVGVDTLISPSPSSH